jgi:hypothetical protein
MSKVRRRALAPFRINRWPYTRNSWSAEEVRTLHSMHAFHRLEAKVHRPPGASTHTGSTLRIVLPCILSAIAILLLLSHCRDVRFRSRQGAATSSCRPDQATCLKSMVQGAHPERRDGIAGKGAARRMLLDEGAGRKLLQDSSNVTSAISPTAAESGFVNSPTSSGTANSATSAALAAGNAGKAATIAAEATGTGHPWHAL